MAVKLKIIENFIVDAVGNQGKDPDVDYSKVVLEVAVENRENLRYVFNGNVHFLVDDKGRTKILPIHPNGEKRRTLEKRVIIERKSQDVIWMEVLFENKEMLNIFKNGTKDVPCIVILELNDIFNMETAFVKEKISLSLNGARKLEKDALEVE
jgi:hypothetical protein